MASLYPKKIGGHTYWYLREMARVDGRPKMVSERYLGSAADIAAAVAGAEQAMLPERSRHQAFGAVAAAWGILTDLGVPGLVDEVIGPRRRDVSVPAGTYLALAALNRIVEPCSKRGFARWWATTAADRFLKIPAVALDHRKFWDAMHAVTPGQLEEISHRLAVAMAQRYQLDCSSVSPDMTKFATFIDTGNQKAPIAQRGKAKQQRPDLLAIPARRLAVLDEDRFGGLTGYDTRREVYGAERRAILTHSPQLHAAQARGLDGTTLAKATRKLDELAATLARGATRRPRPKVAAEIEKITSKTWVRRVITWQLTVQSPKDHRLDWHIDQAARAALETELFGKHVLITSRDDWPAADVVAAYRSQSDAEFSFRQMKDPHVARGLPRAARPAAGPGRRQRRRRPGMRLVSAALLAGPVTLVLLSPWLAARLFDGRAPARTVATFHLLALTGMALLPLVILPCLALVRPADLAALASPNLIRVAQTVSHALAVAY